MSWDYFALFAIVALLFWGWELPHGGKTPGSGIQFSPAWDCHPFSFIVGMWIFWERPPM